MWFYGLVFCIGSIKDESKKGLMNGIAYRVIIIAVSDMQMSPPKIARAWKPSPNDSFSPQSKRIRLPEDFPCFL